MHTILQLKFSSFYFAPLPLNLLAVYCLRERPWMLTSTHQPAGMPQTSFTQTACQDEYVHLKLLLLHKAYRLFRACKYRTQHEAWCFEGELDILPCARQCEYCGVRMLTGAHERS